MSETKTLRRFAGLLVTTLKGRLLVLIGLGLLSSLTAGIGLVLLVPLLSLVGIDAGGGSTEIFVDYVRNALAMFGVEPSAPVLLSLNALLLIGTAALARYRSVVEPRIYESFDLSQRLRLFKALTDARWRYSVNERASNNVHLLTSEIDRLGSAASGLVHLVSKTFLVIIHLVVAIVLSPLLTLLVAVAGLLLAGLTHPLARQAKDRGREVSAAYRALYGSINEHLAGLKTIKAHGLEDRSIEEFDARATAAADAVVGVSRNQANVGFLLQAGSALALTALVWIALSIQSVTPAGLILLLYLFGRLVPMLTGLQRELQSIFSKLGAIELLDDAMTRLGDEREAPSQRREFPRVRGAIELRDVSFDYRTGSDRSVLRGVDLLVPVGRTTAIVGPSGGGKSTTADLIIGLLAPDRGAVLVDGAVLTDEDRPLWRKRVSYVSQDIFLFHDTLRHNLMLANPEASEDDLWEALDASSAGFVRQLPEGLETVIGDRGVKLSGGERQRVALARALLRQPDLLVLDEATSNLDAVNEAKVQEAIHNLHGRVTLLVIAHRLGTVREADAIHVLVDGQVVESGTWSELAKVPNGALRDLAHAQGMLATT